MQTVSISTAKARLNEFVEDAVSTHEHVVITKNGSPAVVMVSAAEWESIQETRFWLAQPGVLADVEQGRREHEAGETLGEEAVRARFGVSRGA